VIPKFLLVLAAALTLAACAGNKQGAVTNTPASAESTVATTAPAAVSADAAGYAMTTASTNGGERAAGTIRGAVLGAGFPITGSTVTLWQAGANAPKQLAQTQTDSAGNFEVPTKDAQAGNTLYLVATGGQPKGAGGDNSAITLLSVVGGTPPAHIVINEMTTLASVITHAQFIDGTAISGPPLGLRIAAGNVPNFVDLQTGGFGETMLDNLNSVQTPTLANFGTLSNILAACVAHLRSDACSSLFGVATPPSGAAPTDTLAVSESIVRYPSHNAAKIFGLLNTLYPLPKFAPGRVLRVTPFLPYLNFAPSAWVFPLRFSGGGLSGPGKLMFDSAGNAWIADNFTVGAQNLDASWTGNITEFAPNGKALSPSPLGFRGGGVAGPGFGLAVDAHDNVWVDSFTGQTISKFDSEGRPLSPPEGWNFNGKLSQMQGIIATPSGDIWAADTLNDQILRLPDGDPTKVQFYCHNATNDPLKNPCKFLSPFALAIDQQNRIWITNFSADHVTRFPASDPSRVSVFKVGYSPTGLAVDSLGNVWVANKLGSSERAHAKLIEMLAAYKFNTMGISDPGQRVTRVFVSAVVAQTPGFESGGSITVLRPDGTQASFSPIYGKGLAAPWNVAIDGNDNVWISNFANSTYGVVELCGFRTEHCAPGMKTGDAISPPGGYVGGGLQLQIDVGIGPAGDVWATNNWQYYPAAFGKVAEALSTTAAGQGVVVFFGMARPVKTPLIGPPRQP